MLRRLTSMRGGLRPTLRLSCLPSRSGTLVSRRMMCTANAKNDESIAQRLEEEEEQEEVVPYRETYVSRTSFFRKSNAIYGLAASSTFAIASVLDALPVASYPLACVGGGYLLSLVGSQVMRRMQCTKYESIDTIAQASDVVPEGQQPLVRYETKNGILRSLSVPMTVLGMGVMITPLVTMMNQAHVSVLPLAMVLPLAAAAGSVLCSAVKPTDRVLKRSVPLLSFASMIGASALASELLSSPNLITPFSNLLASPVTYIGAASIAIMAAQNTQMAVNAYKDETPDHILTGTDFYFNLLLLTVLPLFFLPDNFFLDEDEDE